MRILFFGDIVGRKGREVIRDLLNSLKEKYNPDFIIANAENAAHGKGLTIRVYNELINYGINCLTMGNHTFSKKEIIEEISDMNNLIVPFNIKDKVGEGYRIYDVCDRKVCIVNMLGQALMGEYMLNPFEEYKKIINNTNADIYFVDFHGEATAEKRLFLEYFKDNINCLVGTHTHIQTADEDILYDKIAFISDVGMCGPYYSIIGRDINESIESHINNNKTHYNISESDAILCACVVDFDDNNDAKSIKRIQIRPKTI